MIALQATLAAASGYKLVILAAAVAGRDEPPPEGEPLRLTVLIPAHDEQDVIADTLASLEAADYPGEMLERVVVADNCSDRTPEVARAAGATVLERRSEELRGKGHALAWALERIADREEPPEAVIILDADCVASPSLPRALAARLRAGAVATQADYRVANPDASAAAALRYAAFALVNTVRPLGRSRLGLSSGLLGTGMAFRWSLLRRVPWSAYSLAEDAEYHLRVVEAGERVVFAPEAAVRSPMPTSLTGSGEQQARWEAGRVALARRWLPSLLRDGLRRRDPVRLATAAEQLMPPQSLLVSASAATVLAGVLRDDRRALRFGLAILASEALFVVAGLAVARAPRGAYRALALAPLLAVRKLRLYARLAAGSGPREWVRTERERPDHRTPAHVHSTSSGKA